MHTDYIDFRPISSLNGLHFVVKDYQRGYKWEEQQIRDLLDDLDNHNHGKYCLQPLIVHHDKDDIELIDGQQRITTIFLIFYYLLDQQFYKLSYQTRAKTKEFLDGDLYLLKQYTSSDWKSFRTENPAYDNVDIYFIFRVYKEIGKWFDEKNIHVDVFLDKLLNQAHVIWYNTFSNSSSGQLVNPETIFLNLNAGKIPLTNSELIKALFILDIQKNFSGEIGKLKAFELASDWDRIENQLQDDTFWSFICDNDYYDSLDTRIDLIIDLVNGVTTINTDKDKKTSYRIYDKLFQEGEKLDWQVIKQSFNKIEEWYFDKEIYHYIGFLIVTRLEKLSSIVKFSKGQTKEKFKEFLADKIREQFSKTKKEGDQKIPIYKTENLHYEKYRAACQHVLLLLNIKDYLNRSSQEKFPFDLYLKEKWSVEHINPQNPRGFKTIREVKEWLDSYSHYFKENADANQTDLIEKIEFLSHSFNRKRDLDSKFADFRFEKEEREIYDQVIEKITDELSLHEIGNLCLLDRNTNSKLGNRVFLEKRKAIMEIYFKERSNEKTIYIPNCTKDVFLKVFSKNNSSITDTIFGLNDMHDYTRHISHQLSNFYLKKP
ncbi:MAG: DUF262 domain-containing protein [Mongoliitalea sp.]